MIRESSGGEVTLSVVIPAFNEDKTVAAVIERVLAEVPYDLEVIVVDDGSTDRTAEIVDRIAERDPRVRAIQIKLVVAPTDEDVVVILDDRLPQVPVAAREIHDVVVTGG